MLKQRIARRLIKWFGPRLTRQIAAEHMRGLSAGRPPKPYPHAPQLSELPDFARRRAFFDDHVLIHTHIPKTAGSSLAAGLAAIVGGLHFIDIRLPRSARLVDIPPDQMHEIWCVSSHMGFGLHELFDRTPLYFAAVRDPVDRAISYYRYLQDRPTEENSKFAIGLSFAESWRALNAERGAAFQNMQSRMLCSRVDDQLLDEDLVWRRVEQDYFLITPHDQVTKTIQRLRKAFGLFKTPLPKLNVSQSEQVEPSAALIEEIRAANAVDARLHQHVTAEFQNNLDRACQMIAQRCLQPLDTK